MTYKAYFTYTRKGYRGKVKNYLSDGYNDKDKALYI
jgi:hypothetical protein